MSIEKNIERIATALERIAGAMEHQKPVAEEVSKPEPAPVKDDKPATPPAPKQTEAAAPPPPAGKQESAPSTVPPAPTTPASVSTGEPDMTPQELNNALVTEFKRLGNNREPIDKVMVEQFGVQSISNLPADKRRDLLAAVQALPGA